MEAAETTCTLKKQQKQNVVENVSTTFVLFVWLQKKKYIKKNKRLQEQAVWQLFNIFVEKTALNKYTILINCQTNLKLRG